MIIYKKVCKRYMAFLHTVTVIHQYFKAFPRVTLTFLYFGFKLYLLLWEMQKSIVSSLYLATISSNMHIDVLGGTEWFSLESNWKQSEVIWITEQRRYPFISRCETYRPGRSGLYHSCGPSLLSLHNPL